MPIHTPLKRFLMISRYRMPHHYKPICQKGLNEKQLVEHAMHL